MKHQSSDGEVVVMHLVITQDLLLLDPIEEVTRSARTPTAAGGETTAHARCVTLFAIGCGLSVIPGPDCEART